MSKTIVGWKDINPSEETLQKIAALPQGVPMIVFAKHVNDSSGMDKLQLEFAEKVVTPGRQVNALGLFNAGDERFGSGARRAWVNITAAQAKNIFGISLPDDVGYVELAKSLAGFDFQGNEFHVRVVEAVESELPNNIKHSDIENKQRYLKRRGPDGPVFRTSSGESIYSYTEVVITQPGQSVNHRLLEGTASEQALVSAVTQSAAISGGLAEATQG